VVTVLYVNDREVRTRAPAGTTVLDVLREELDLTATKPGCRTGDCGACTVLVGSRAADDQQPVYELHNSCLTTLAMVQGCHVVTAEGLVGESLGPVQTALLDDGGVQCGYCTPGVVVALTWAMLSGTDPQRAVAGNLCRCTGYGGIRRACDRLPRRIPLETLLPQPVLAVAVALPALEPQSLDAGRGWVAGATDEIPEHRHVIAAHRRPTLLARVPQLRRIEDYGGGIELGSAVTIAEVQRSELICSRWPRLADHLELFGSPAVRAAGTVGGNLVHASPTADLAPPLLAMAARVVIVGVDGQREIALEHFFRDYHHVALRRGEMVLAVRIPDPVPGARLHLEKVAKRRLDDIATVSLAVVLQGSDPVAEIRIAAGGVAAFPLLLPATADTLRGRRIDVAAIREAMAVLAEEISPIDDVRGSKIYKRTLLGHLLVAALTDGDADLAAEVIAPAGSLP
jgi:xanthine dehydrogenase small subunit